MFGVKNLFASKTVWGAIVAVLGTVAQSAGYLMTEVDAAELVELAGQGVAIAGALYAIYGRIVATKQVAVSTPEAE